MSPNHVRAGGVRQNGIRRWQEAGSRLAGELRRKQRRHLTERHVNAVISAHGRLYADVQFSPNPHTAICREADFAGGALAQIYGYKPQVYSPRSVARRGPRGNMQT